MNGEVLLVILIIVGLIGRSPIITTAACVLLIVKLISLDRFLPTIERRGLELLKLDPQLIVGLVIGSIFGIVFMKGIPVGPLMAAGITAFLLKLFFFIGDKIK